MIVSEEILTSEGEILGYFMSEEIPDGIPPLEVVKRLQDQGALSASPTPFDPWRGSTWNPGTLEELVPYLDGIEAFNARCRKPIYNEKPESLQMNTAWHGWSARTRTPYPSLVGRY